MKKPARSSTPAATSTPSAKAESIRQLSPEARKRLLEAMTRFFRVQGGASSTLH
jgi:hypothetical protein